MGDPFPFKTAEERITILYLVVEIGVHITLQCHLWVDK